MKNVTFFSVFVISALFLPACLRKKPKDNQKPIDSALDVNSTNDTIMISRDTITSTKNEEKEHSVTRKSIFDEDENDTNSDEIIIERELSRDNLLNSSTGEGISTYEKGVIGKNIGTVHFDFDVFQYIRRDEIKTIDDIIKNINNLLSQNKDISIMIRGHACNSAGSEKYNMQLSDRRALAIKEYFLKNTAISSENISAYGLGTAELIATGNKEQQAPNRRAEIYISY
jgi:outer membrane protein OmpA-like peptidoglycan-associated protein